MMTSASTHTGLARRCLLSLALLLTAGLAQATQVATFDTNFSTTESLFGGPSGGFDESGSFGSFAGISYDVKANSGTVNASVAGQIQATYTDTLNPNTSANVGLQFLGGSSSVSSALGASATVTGFLDICVIPNPFGGCITRIDTDFDLLDEGLFLDPSRSFTANLGASASRTDTDSAIGFGPNLDLIIGELGAEVNLDIEQEITLTLQEISGLLSYTNRRTDQTFLTPFSIGAGDSVDLLTEMLEPGVWDFSLLSISLDNSFRNDVDLEIRPTINYVLGEWPEPGNELFALGLLDDTFDLNFNEEMATNLFTIQVVPVPGAAVLLVSALAGLGVVRLPRRA